jgi:hypothetical protein
MIIFGALKLEGFEEVIKEAWIWDDSIVNPFWCLDALFRNAAEYLQAWGQRKTDNIKLQLYQGELWLCRTLKLHVLGIHHWRRQLREKDHGSDGLEREMSIPRSRQW